MYINEYYSPEGRTKLVFEKPAGWHVVLGANKVTKLNLIEKITLCSFDLFNQFIEENGVDALAYERFYYLGLGANRRFDGGDGYMTEQTRENIRFYCLFSAIHKSFSFSHTPQWVHFLRYSELEGDLTSGVAYKAIIHLVNNGLLEADNLRLSEFNSEGVFISDLINYEKIKALDAGDEATAVLVIAFTLFHTLSEIFGTDKVFLTEAPETIDLPGVVLIDDFEARLSPATQIRFSEWLVKTFPQIQFIVTSNSPFVCRACEGGGTIWKLERGKDGVEYNEVTGLSKDRIIYGNILDAYGTEVFGRDEVLRSKKGQELYSRLTELLNKSYGAICTTEEKAEIKKLREIFATRE